MFVRTNLMLTMPAIETRALPDPSGLDGGAADCARLTGAAIDLELYAEIAGSTFFVAEIVQGCATGGNGFFQDLADVLCQSAVAGQVNVAGRQGRMNAGSEQRLAGVDVADAHHNPVIHDKGFYGKISLPGATEQIVAAERLGQGFRAVVGQQGMREWLVAGPNEGAELADIVQPQTDAAGKTDISVIMASGRYRFLEHAQKSTHAQVQDQAALVAAKQQIFSSSFNCPDGLFERLQGKVLLQRLSQFGNPQFHPDYFPLQNPWFNTSTDSLYFRQFRHICSLASWFDIRATIPS